MQLKPSMTIPAIYYTTYLSTLFVYIDPFSAINMLLKPQPAVHR